MIRVLFSFFICILLPGQILFAELPFSVSDETIFHRDLDNELSCLENELILEKEFDLLHGLTIGAENLYLLDDLENSFYGDEITLGGSICILPFFGVGAAHKIFIIEEQDTEHGLDLNCILFHEFEDLGLSIEDENEFIYNYTPENWGYVNTFALEKSIHSFSDTTSLLFYLENEYADTFIQGCKADDVLIAGPVLNISFVSVALYYAPILAPEYSSGLEASLMVQF